MANRPRCNRTPSQLSPSPRRLALLNAWLSSPALLLGLVATPAQAGSVTAESIWDRGNAIQRAQSQVPAGTCDWARWMALPLSQIDSAVTDPA